VPLPVVCQLSQTVTVVTTLECVWHKSHAPTLTWPKAMSTWHKSHHPRWCDKSHLTGAPHLVKGPVTNVTPEGVTFITLSRPPGG